MNRRTVDAMHRFKHANALRVEIQLTAAQTYAYDITELN